MQIMHIMQFYPIRVGAARASLLQHRCAHLFIYCRELPSFSQVLFMLAATLCTEREWRNLTAASYTATLRHLQAVELQSDSAFDEGGPEVVWYLAEIVIAEPPEPDRAEYQCEASSVVFQAANSSEAYQKAIAWGQAYADDSPARMRLLGVSHLTTVGEELCDGTEICGQFFQAPAVWERVGEFVPPQDQLGAVRWEQGRDVPVGELLSPEQVAQLKRTWGQDA